MSDSAPEDGSEQEELPLPAMDLTDPKAVRMSRDKLKREKQERAAFWRAVLNDRIGRRELWRWIASEGHAFNPEFACGPNGTPQPEATWFRAGEQQFALKLYHELAAMDREGVLKMHDEHDSRFAAEKRTRKVG